MEKDWEYNFIYGTCIQPPSVKSSFSRKIWANKYESFLHLYLIHWKKIIVILILAFMLWMEMDWILKHSNTSFDCLSLVEESGSWKDQKWIINYKFFCTTKINKILIQCYSLILCKLYPDFKKIFKSCLNKWKSNYVGKMRKIKSENWLLLLFFLFCF